MSSWYARPVLSVRDASEALAFYASKLGFGEVWRHEEAGRLRIVQVSRDGCDLILSDQWPDDVGCARLFISLEPSDFEQLISESKGRGVELKSGFWGYELAIIEDPDGNRLWFPKPSCASTSS